jgi:hypothetical protein
LNHSHVLLAGLDGAETKMDIEQVEIKEYQTPEEQYLEETKPIRFKLPVGESYIEFLSEGERKDVLYGEGNMENKMVYRINAFDKHGLQIAKDEEFAMPKTILDAIHELRLQRQGKVIGGWLKVKREGTDKTSTKYQPYPMGSKPVF